MPFLSGDVFDREDLVKNVKMLVSERINFHILHINNNTKLFNGFKDFEKAANREKLTYWLLRKHKLSQYLDDFEKVVVVGAERWPYVVTTNLQHILPQTLEHLKLEVEKLTVKKLSFLKKRLEAGRQILHLWRNIDYHSDFQLTSLAATFATGVYLDLQTFEEDLLAPWIQWKSTTQFKIDDENENYLELSKVEKSDMGQRTENAEVKRVDKLFEKLWHRLQLENEVLTKYFQEKKSNLNGKFVHVSDDGDVLYIRRVIDIESLIENSESCSDCSVDEEEIGKSEEEKTAIAEEVIEKVAKGSDLKIEEVPLRIRNDREEWKKPKNVSKRHVNPLKLMEAIKLRKVMDGPENQSRDESPMVGKEKTGSNVESTTKQATAHKIGRKTTKKQRKQKQKEVKDKKDMEDNIAMAEALEEKCEETDNETRHLYEGLLRMYTDRTKEMPKELSRILAKKFMDVRVKELMEVVEKLGNDDSEKLRAEDEEEENPSWWEMRKWIKMYDRYVQLSQMELSDDTIAEICFLQSEKKNEAFVYLEEIFIQKFSD